MLRLEIIQGEGRTNKTSVDTNAQIDSRIRNKNHPIRYKDDKSIQVQVYYVLSCIFTSLFFVVDLKLGTKELVPYGLVPAPRTMLTTLRRSWKEYQYEQHIRFREDPDVLDELPSQKRLTMAQPMDPRPLSPGKLCHAIYQ